MLHMVIDTTAYRNKKNTLNKTISLLYFFKFNNNNLLNDTHNKFNESFFFLNFFKGKVSS